MSNRVKPLLRKLSSKYLESVVGLTAFWKDAAKRKSNCFGTGTIIYSSVKFLLVLTCAHLFKSLTVSIGPPFDSEKDLRCNTYLMVSFIDGQMTEGLIHFHDWARDLCLILVPLFQFEIEGPYRSVKFIDETRHTRKSVYKRGSDVFSLFCVPTRQKDNNLLFGTSTHGRMCGKKNISADDLDPIFEPELQLFEFDMATCRGSSGGPIFCDRFEVMGIWMMQFDCVMFGIKTSEIRKWLLECIGVKKDFDMEETLEIVSASIAKSGVLEILEENRSRRHLTT